MKEEKKLIDDETETEGSFDLLKAMTIYDVMFYITGIPEELKMKLIEIKVVNRCEPLIEIYSDYNWNLLLQAISKDDTEYAKNPKTDLKRDENNIEE